MCRFLDVAPGVAAFCKNDGPQLLRVDYLSVVFHFTTHQGQPTIALETVGTHEEVY